MAADQTLPSDTREPLTAREQAARLATRVQEEIAQLGCLIDDAVEPGDRRPPVIVEALMRDTQSILLGIAAGHIPLGQRVLATNWIRLVDALDRAGYSQLGSEFAEFLTPLSQMGLTIDGHKLGRPRFSDRSSEPLHQ